MDGWSTGPATDPFRGTPTPPTGPVTFGPAPSAPTWGPAGSVGFDQGSPPTSGAPWGGAPPVPPAWSTTPTWGSVTIPPGQRVAVPPPRQSGPTGLQIGLIIAGALIVAATIFGVLVARAIGDATESLPFNPGFGPVQSGESYGDNPQLDTLWDGCVAGDFAACDELYFVSPLGSEYEDFGDSCGNRNVPAGLCTTIYGD